MRRRADNKTDNQILKYEYLAHFFKRVVRDDYFWLFFLSKVVKRAMFARLDYFHTFSARILCPAHMSDHIAPGSQSTWLKKKTLETVVKIGHPKVR